MARIYNCAESSDLLSGMRSARQAIALGEVIVMPTDTVYGLAADAFNHQAVARILEVKGRTRQSPPPVLVSDMATVEALAEVLPEPIRDLFLAYAPGPLTVILPARTSLSWDLGDTMGTVALRIPKHDIALELLRETGPLAVSSANRHGEPAAVTAEEADDSLGDDVNVILDGGVGAGDPSTILDATGLADNPPRAARIVRQGALSRSDIARVLGEWLEPEEVANSKDEAPESLENSETGDGSA